MHAVTIVMGADTSTSADIDAARAAVVTSPTATRFMSCDCVGFTAADPMVVVLSRKSEMTLVASVFAPSLPSKGAFMSSP